jgi:hypothetical protein
VRLKEKHMAKIFVCRAFSGRFFLCRALYKKTYGKQILCRAPDVKRTAKMETHGNGRFSRSVDP